jgi:peptide/nickel transport system substrate-binding protein
MGEAKRRVDELRRTSTEVENHLIDELAAGKISRREFVRRGTVLGLSLPALSFIASACGGDDDGGDGSATGATDTTGGTPRQGGTLRTALITPAGALDPLTVGDEGGLAVLGQSGEYLAWSDDELILQPRIAESWEPNEDGSVWTFAIRQGVTFHDGTPLTAEDVVATIEYHLGNESNALSALGGVLSAGSTELVDESTVQFTLDAPNGNFPYLLSSDNYNLIVLPKTFTGDWESTFVGTGPWKLETYTPEVGVTYVRNPDYWDASRVPLADRSEVKFYEDEQARVIALQGDEVDIVSNFSVAGGGALLGDEAITLIELRAAQHRVVHMRVDMEPFTDKRVRQAMALALDRQALVDGLFNGKADLGNDSPFAPVFPSTDPSVSQRAQDIEQAKQLLQAAGKGSGFAVTLESWQGFEIPDLAVLVQNAAEEIGVTVELQITDDGAYYGDFTYGGSRWLDSSFGITDWGHRGVPNVFLSSALASEGIYNAPHFKNPAFDQLLADYVAAFDLDSQRAVAGQIQQLLLDETPAIIPYFYFHLAATKKVEGVEPTGMGHFDLARAGFVS